MFRDCSSWGSSLVGMNVVLGDALWCPSDQWSFLGWDSPKVSLIELEHVSHWRVERSTFSYFLTTAETIFTTNSTQTNAGIACNQRIIKHPRCISWASPLH
jgi:hypothetical protein